MIKKRAFKLLNTVSGAEAVIDAGFAAVGFVFDTPVLPRNCIVSSAYGKVAARRREIVPLRTDGRYVVTLEDTWAGDIQSNVYGLIEDYADDYERVGGDQKGEGWIYITIFQTTEEMTHYKIGESSDVWFIPKLESIRTVSQDYVLGNIDYDACTIFAINDSSGYFVCFQVFSGHRQGDFANVKSREILGYLTAPDLTSSSFRGGILSLSGTRNIGFTVMTTSATLSSQRSFMIFRFHQKVSARKVDGFSMATGVLTTAGTGTEVSFDFPSPRIGGYTGYLFAFTNVGSNALSNVFWSALSIDVRNTSKYVLGNMVSSTTLAAGASNFARQNHGQEYLRVRASDTAGSPSSLLWYVSNGY